MRQKVLSSAYLRAVKDPFPPARQAGILAMSATHNYFTLADIAYRLLPALALLTIDPDKGVRDQVWMRNCFICYFFCKGLWVEQAAEVAGSEISCKIFRIDISTGIFPSCVGIQSYQGVYRQARESI